MPKVISIITSIKTDVLFPAKPHILSLTKLWPFLAVAIAHTIWGGNFIVAKLTLGEIPPMSLAFLRFALATLLLSPFILGAKEEVKIEKQDLPRLILIGVLMVTFNIALFFEGLNRTTAISASVLTMLVPIFSVITGWWFLKEHIYTINLGGLVLGLIGAVITFNGLSFFSGTHLNSDYLLGNLLIVLASITWVLGATISKKLLEKYSTLTITFIIFAIGAITFIIPAIAEFLNNPLWISKLTLFGILGLTYITILSSITAYFLFEWGLRKIGIIKADLFQYIEPIIASILGVAILSEKVSPAFGIGAILVAIGVYLTTIGKPEHKHHKAHRN